MKIRSYKIYTIFLIFSLLIISSFIFFETIYLSNENNTAALQNTSNVAKRREASILELFGHAENLLKSIRTSHSFIAYINGQDPQALLTSDLLLTFAKVHTNIKQLRYIDIDGQEKIRIDRDAQGFLKIAPKEALKNKKSRYYFKQAINQPSEKVWYSNLDLNIEDDKVEIPYVPTLRAALPVQENGKIQGVLIVNYTMQDFLDQFFKTSSYDMILLNAQGYILQHYDARKNWSFYANKQFTIADEYPKYAKEILSKDYFKTKQFVSIKLNIPIEDTLILILKLKQSYLTEVMQEQVQRYLTIGFILIVLMSFFSIIVTKIVNSITDKLDKTKDMNHKLQELNKTLNDAQKIQNIAFWERNMQTSSLFWSDEMYNIFDIEDRSVNPSYDLILSFMTQDDQDRLSLEFPKSIKEHKQYYAVYKIKTKSNQRKYIEERATHLYDKSGKHIKSIGSFNDNTDAMIGQKKEEEYMSLIDENIITSSTDLKATIISVSDAFCKISGYAKEELIGNDHRMIMHENIDTAVFKKLWIDISHDIVWNGDLEKTRKDGTSYWVHTTIYPTYNDEGDKTGYTAIMQDITSQKLLEDLSITDALTGIYNRRYFNETFRKILLSSKRKNELVSFVIMDIDHFKQYNDTYGHQAGDIALKEVASAIQDSLKRADDYCFRLGGEEFGVIFKVEDQEDAVVFSNTIRVAIEKLKIKHENNSASPYVTVSMGLVSQLACDIKDDDSIYKEADDLLYIAKESGRNKLVSNIN